MSKLTPERLDELEQQLMQIQHELQSVVRPANSDNNVLLKYAQDQAVGHAHNTRVWVEVLKGYLVS